MKKRVMVILHKSLVPPEEIPKDLTVNEQPWQTEYNVIESLKRLGHEVFVVGLENDLSVLRKAIGEFKPQSVFNLLVEFQGSLIFEQNIVSYLELMRVPYTGCNPRGLMLASDKALSKKILSYHRIPTPKFFVVPKGQKVRKSKAVQFPLIVKSLIEEASTGISQSSVVRNFSALEERVQFIHEKIETDAIVESYVEGRELYVSILGNKQLSFFSIWELDFSHMPESSEKIATQKVKWDANYQKKHRLKWKAVKGLEPSHEKAIYDVCKRVFRRLGLNGYARIDIRLSENGTPYVIEANPNPDLADDAEYALSAKNSGLSYDELIQKIVTSSLTWFRNRR